MMMVSVHGRRSTLLTIALAAVLLPRQTEGLWFYLAEGDTRCYVEEVPESTLVVGTFKVGDHGADNTATDLPSCKVVVSDPREVELTSRTIDREGRFAFTSESGGEHRICVSTTSSHWFGNARKMKVDIKIDVGERAIEYGAIAKKDGLDDMTIKVKRLVDKVGDIRSEQQYMRTREEAFRDTAESFNARAAWLNIIQIVVVIAVGAYQISHLRGFFQKKKLV